jgi:Flp pilus assembly protein TadG
MMRPGRNDRRGSVALEFALVGMAFFGLLLLILQLGFILYAQTALDYAAKQASRMMQTGQSSPTTQTSFQSAVFCPYLSNFLNCAKVTTTLQRVTSFQSVPAPSTPYDPGTTNSLMLLQATYTTGLPIWPLNVIQIVGTAAYLNEY